MKNTENDNDKDGAPPESVANPASTMAIDKDKKLEQYLAYGFGLVFIVVVLVLAIVFPKPEPFQYLVFKIILALAAAGITAFIPGFLHVQVSTIVRAGGAIAVFVIVFFFNPATLVSDSTQTKVEPKVEPTPSITIPANKEVTLEVVINNLSRSENRGDARFNNCSDSVKKAKVKPGLIAASNVTNLINSLQNNLVEPVSVKLYEAKLTEVGYEVNCQ